MNYTALALSFAFGALGIPFLGKARREGDPTQRRNKRIAASFFLIAAAGFLTAFVISAVAD